VEKQEIKVFSNTKRKESGLVSTMRLRSHIFNLVRLPSHAVSSSNQVVHHQLWYSLQVDEAKGLDSCNPYQEAACGYRSLAKHGHCGQDSGAGTQTQHRHCAL